MVFTTDIRILNMTIYMLVP